MSRLARTGLCWFRAARTRVSGCGTFSVAANSIEVAHTGDAACAMVLWGNCFYNTAVSFQNGPAFKAYSVANQAAGKGVARSDGSC